MNLEILADKIASLGHYDPEEIDPDAGDTMDDLLFPDHIESLAGWLQADQGLTLTVAELTAMTIDEIMGRAA